MTTPLESRFAEIHAEGRAALIGYLPAGFPTVEKCIELVSAMVDGGVDIVEIGFPYSDPVMDGPVIQAASEVALAAGTSAQDVLAIARAIAAKAPTLVMTYWNPIERYGVDDFAADLHAHGGSGVITPDLTIEESQSWISATSAHDINRVYVVAPSSSDTRLAQVSEKCSGFIYAASLMGVTGTRTAISANAQELVARLRNVTKLPISVGLGVSTPEQASEVAQYADGVIVGSAFVKAIQSAASHQDALRAVKELASSLRAAVVRN